VTRDHLLDAAHVDKVRPDPENHRSMIPKKPVPDLIRDGNRFSEKIMLHPKNRA
jgi:hypothetical protein